MTSRERLLKVIAGEIPDCVPVSPDTSNMIPAKMTGMPFWDIYLYKKIPIWKAYINCVKHFGFDSLMDGYAPVRFAEIGEYDPESKTAIVFKNDEKIITRFVKKAEKYHFSDTCMIFTKENPPAYGINYKKLGLDETPASFEIVEPENPVPDGEELLKEVKKEMGDHGLVGVFCSGLSLISSEEAIYDYYDNPDIYIERAEKRTDMAKKKLHKLMGLNVKPDFICLGSSGTMIYNTPDMFNKLSLKYLKEMTALCKQYNIPTHVHSCGPEKELVKIAAEQTDLTIIDPLEIKPMGDCELKELKRLYGNKLVLKGNIHTTDVMLRGSALDVKRACERAIDDAKEGGRFILSTGDQCGRDTPFENLEAMIETARTYGKYN